MKMVKAMVMLAGAIAVTVPMFAMQVQAEVWSETLYDTPSWTFIGKFCWEDTPVRAVQVLVQVLVPRGT